MDTRTSVHWIQYKASTPGGTFTINAQGDNINSGRVAVLNGYDIERFHSRSAKGELLPLTPFSQIEYKLDANRTGVYGPVTKPNLQTFKIEENWITSVGYSYLTYDDAVGTANAKANGLDPAPYVQAAAAKIYSQGHDTLTFLLELHKTVALFKGLFSRLKELMALSDKAGSWLEYRYGWRILWFDIVELQKTLTSLDDGRKRFSERVGQSHTEQNITMLSYNDSSVLNDVTITDTFSVGVRGTVIADIQPPKFQFNPILTGWEVIKFSFIIDWFLGVGTWLESLSFLASQLNYVAAGGTYVSLDRTLSYGPGSLVTGHTGTFDFGGPHHVTVAVTTRTPATISKFPLVRVNLNSLKVIDLLAIISKFTRGFSRSLRL